MMLFFPSSGGSVDIILISSVRLDDQAFDSKFVTLCFFTFSQEDNKLAFLFKDKRFHSVIQVLPSFVALVFFGMVSKYSLRY